MMGFISLLDEIPFMLINSCRICIRSIRRLPINWYKSSVSTSNTELYDPTDACQPTVSPLMGDNRPTNGKQSADSRPTVNQQSYKVCHPAVRCWFSVGKMSVSGVWLH